LAADTYLGKIENIHEIITQEDSKCSVPKRLQITETVRRYQNIDKITSQITEKKPQLKELLTEKLDKILVHKFGDMLFFY
jgi:ferrous iron transport protein B